MPNLAQAVRKAQKLVINTSLFHKELYSIPNSFCCCGCYMEMIRDIFENIIRQRKSRQLGQLSALAEVLQPEVDSLGLATTWRHIH